MTKLDQDIVRKVWDEVSGYADDPAYSNLSDTVANILSIVARDEITPADVRRAMGLIRDIQTTSIPTADWRVLYGGTGPST